MKKILFFLVLSIYSCKQNNYENESYVIDSNALTVEESIVDSAETISKDSVKEFPKREITFEEALETNSIFDLKMFIENNSGHEKIKDLKARLIDLEVNEIMSDNKTGQMPISDKIGESNSNTSEISIQNDTSCELEVRYSGIESKMISIPAHQSSIILLKSGNYRVAATACGSNYAGNEYLSGNYSSSYYIVTSFR